MRTAPRSVAAVRRQTTGSSGAILEVHSNAKPQVLVVDDDTRLLASLERHLKVRYDVTVTTDGGRACGFLEARSFAALITDLRLPGVSGCEVLSHAREVSPDTVRILMSGTPDVEGVTTAINDGRIFRFLPKPSTSSALHGALAEAVDLHRTTVADRALVQQTIEAGIGTLVDLLAILQPGSYKRPRRIRHLAEGVAAHLGLQTQWTLGIAAELALVGYIIVPRETMLRARRGVPLSDAEEVLMLKVLPFVGQLVASIPRFDHVRSLLRLQWDPEFVADAETTRLGEVLRTAIAFEDLEDAGLCPDSALDRLSCTGKVDMKMLRALGQFCAEARPRKTIPPMSNSKPTVQQSSAPPSRMISRPAIDDEEHVDRDVSTLPLADVQCGMRFARDVLGANGVVLIARGQIVSRGLVERIETVWSSFAHDVMVQIENSDRGDRRIGLFERVV